MIRGLLLGFAAKRNAESMRRLGGGKGAMLLTIKNQGRHHFEKASGATESSNCVEIRRSLLSVKQRQLCSSRTASSITSRMMSTAAASEMIEKHYTLALIFRGSVNIEDAVVPSRRPEVLLGLKKRGFGMGKWNGFGGKVEPGETPIDAAAREVQEECDLYVGKLKEAGSLQFTFKSNPVKMMVHVFRTAEFAGEPKETEEMRPQWFNLSDIPYTSMWADDKHWLPHVIAGKNVIGIFNFDDDEETILDFDLKVFESNESGQDSP